MTTALLTLVLLGAPSAEPYYADADIGVAFPKEIGDFVAEKREEFSSKGLGYGVLYRSGNDAALHLYVFDAGLQNIENGKGSKDLKTLFDRAIGEVRQVEKLGYYKNVKEIEVGEGFSETVMSDFLCTKLTYQVSRDKTKPGREVVSYLFGTGYKRKMVKVKCTVSAKQTIEKELNGFLEALLKLLEKSGGLT